MPDTNWCTFCDRAVNPLSNPIYCSEECYRRDALTHNPILLAYIEQQQRIQKQQDIAATVQSSIDPIMSPPHGQSRRGSCSSICSKDLAAMHFDTIPPSPPNEKIEPVQLTCHPVPPTNKSSSNSPPFLSTSTSPASSHGELALGTPINFSYNLPACEKLSSIPATTNNRLLHNNHSLPQLQHQYQTHTKN